MIARAVASQVAAVAGGVAIFTRCAAQAFAKMFVVNGPEIVGMFGQSLRLWTTLSRVVGESEAKLRQVFTKACRPLATHGNQFQAALHAPAVVFLDEIDAICPARQSGSEQAPLRSR